MIINHFKILLRSFKNDRTYSILNILGFAIGISSSMAIFFYVQGELSYDNFLNNSEHIFRIGTKFKEFDNIVHVNNLSSKLAPLLKSTYPEIQQTTRYRSNRKSSIMSNENHLSNYESNIYFTDQSFFNLFSFDFIYGNPTTALSRPYNIVITEKTSRKYFADSRPIGKILYYESKIPFTISGVIKDIPFNSHFKFDFLCSLPDNELNDPKTYIMLNRNTVPAQFENKLSSIVKLYGKTLNIDGQLYIESLKKIHLNEEIDIRYLYTFSIIGFLILIIACLNYINLATSKAIKRNKEVGIRKTLGSSRNQLIQQFLSESFFYSFMGFILSLIILEISKPFLINLFNRELNYNFSNNPYSILIVISVLLFSGLVSGSYPAFFLSKLKPSAILKGVSYIGNFNSNFRKIIVVFQFVISTILIISAVIIYKQLDYIQNKNLGFDKENVIILEDIPSSIQKHYNALKNDLLKHPNIRSVTAGWIPGIKSGNLWICKDPETDKGVSFQIADVDYDYFRTLGIEIVTGRTFSKEYPDDKNNSVIVNETMLNYLSLKDPIGNRIRFAPSLGEIIGVVKDYHIKTMHSKIGPLAIGLKTDGHRNIIIRTGPDRFSQIINTIKVSWKEYDRFSPINFSFLDDNVNKQYEFEIRSRKIINTFTMIALIISCLGLFGLMSLIIEQRTMEIGIRKVLGASISNILTLFSKECILLVFISNIIACPIGWFVMNKWLQNFAYHVSISILIYVIVCMITVFISILTISIKIFKASILNPVKTLMYE